MKLYKIFLFSLFLTLIFSKINKPKIIENLKKQTEFKGDKKNTFIVIGKLLLSKNYPPSFIAGILGNIYHEGSIGFFESSNYVSHPQLKPQYLKYMDELHDYRKKYSGKKITEVSLKELKKLIDVLKIQNWKKGKFGLGCVQWTGERTYDLVKLYLNEAKGKDKISIDEATVAEGKLIIKELSGPYKHVFNEWKKNTKKDSEQAAYNAADIICRKYEIPADAVKRGKERGKTAARIYNIMMKGV